MIIRHADIDLQQAFIAVCKSFVYETILKYILFNFGWKKEVFIQEVNFQV